MAPKIRVPTEEWSAMSARVRNILQETTEGRNPHVQFQFREIRLPRGYVEHPPSTDRTEVRNSISVEFIGTANGNLLVHLFNDGTIKTREQMYAETNHRIEEDRRLSAEESQFPHLNQTATRKQAEAKMMAKIQALRNDRNMSIIAKQIEKRNAETEYANFLKAQASIRAAAAAVAKSAAEQT